MFLKNIFPQHFDTFWWKKSILLRFTIGNPIVISQASHFFKNFKHFVSLTFLIFIFLVEIFSGDILVTSSFNENEDLSG